MKRSEDVASDIIVFLIGAWVAYKLLPGFFESEIHYIRRLYEIEKEVRR